MQTNSDRDGDRLAVEWSVHGLKESPRGLALVVAGYCAALWLWLRLFPEPAGLFLPLVGLTSALAEYLFPIRYRIASDGIHARCGWFQQLHLPWDRVRRITRGADGCFVSPFVKPTRLDAFRGIRLRVPPHERERVTSAIVALRSNAMNRVAEDVSVA